MEISHWHVWQYLTILILYTAYTSICQVSFYQSPRKLLLESNRSDYCRAFEMSTLHMDGTARDPISYKVSAQYFGTSPCTDIMFDDGNLSMLIFTISKAEVFLTYQVRGTYILFLFTQNHLQKWMAEISLSPLLQTMDLSTEILWCILCHYLALDFLEEADTYLGNTAEMGNVDFISSCSFLPWFIVITCISQQTKKDYQRWHYHIFKLILCNCRLPFERRVVHNVSRVAMKGVALSTPVYCVSKPCVLGKNQPWRCSTYQAYLLVLFLS